MSNSERSQFKTLVKQLRRHPFTEGAIVRALAERFDISWKQAELLL